MKYGFSKFALSSNSPQSLFARMAELVDALDSKSSTRKGVKVRFLFRAHVTA